MPKSKKHPVTAPDAVHAEMLTDEIGLLKVAMFPGAIGIDVAKDIDRGIAALLVMRVLHLSFLPVSISQLTDCPLALA
jgi:hypothetical protein